METRLQAKRERYRKILGCLLLTDIIKYLPAKEKLAIRLVNKDFEDAATHAFKRSEVTFDLAHRRLDSFLLDFMVPQLTQSRLMSRAKVSLQPESNSLERLKQLGLNFGAEIRHLQIDFPNEETNPNVASKVKYLLNFCNNLNKLEIGNSPTRNLVEPEESEAGMETSIPEEVAAVNDLPILREANFCVSVPQLDLIYDILGGSKIHTLSLEILGRASEEEEDHDLDLVTSQETAANFFKRVELIPNLVILSVMLNFPNPSGTNTLFNILVTSDVSPQQLTISFEDDPLPTEAEKVALRDWLTKLTSRSTLKTLRFCSYNLDGTPIYLPSKMIHLKTLILDLHSYLHDYEEAGHVILNQRLLPAQIPSVEIIHLTAGEEILISTAVYPGVKMLSAGPKMVFHNGAGEEVLLEPNSANWPTMFPNLTTLDISVCQGAESLKSVFTSMTNIIDLTVRFIARPVWGQTTSSPWNIFTNSLEPVMNQETPFKVVMPSLPRSRQPRFEPTPGSCALYNLRGLKALVLLEAPYEILLAVVHFLLTRKLLPLEKFHSRAYYTDPNLPVLTPDAILRSFIKLRNWTEIYGTEN